jgi:hypothetical protein
MLDTWTWFLITHTYDVQLSLSFAIHLIEIQVLMHKDYETRINDMLVPGNSVDVNIIKQLDR